MIKFGFDGYQTEFPNWSKHHKVLSTHVRRVYDNGEVINANDELLKSIVEKNEDKLKSKHVDLFNRTTNDRSSATDYYLPLNNLEYEEADLDYYSVGSSNTKQTTFIRMKFLIENNLLVLSHSFKSSGHYAMSFRNYVEGMDFLEDMIEENIDKGKKIEDVGIEKGHDNDYSIVVANELRCPDSFEIDKNELLESLVAVEIYKYDMTIID
jgi:hypothetical protein